MAITRLGGANAITGTIPQGNIANASLGAVTALPAAIPTGKVLQVVSTSAANDLGTTSTSYVDIHLSLNITPSATSSKIYVNASFPAHVIGTGGGDNGGQYTIYKDSSAVIAVAGDAFYSNNGTGLSLRQNLSVLNSPSTTSAITYKIYFKNRAGSSTQGIMTNSGEGTITAMEIAG